MKIGLVFGCVFCIQLDSKLEYLQTASLNSKALTKQLPTKSFNAATIAAFIFHILTFDFHASIIIWFTLKLLLRFTFEILILSIP